VLNSRLQSIGFTLLPTAILSPLLLPAAQALVSVLQEAHAVTVTFNAVTANNIAKALRAIMRKEEKLLPDQEVCSCQIYIFGVC
jgi:hypothetical protein